MQNVIQPGSLYYVDRKFCDGIECHYHGLLIINYANIMSNEDLVITITYKGHDYSIGHSYLSGVMCFDNYRMAGIIAERFLSLTGDVLRISTPEHRGVEIITHGDGEEKVIVYFRAGLNVTISGNVPGYDEDPDSDVRYLGDNGRDEIYHLCRNASFNYGTCKEKKNNVKSSNISGGVNIDNEGSIVPGDAGDKPIILGNCSLCGHCLDICPRHAIKNSFNNTPTKIDNVRHGKLDALSVEVKATSRSTMGDNAYYSGKVYSSGLEPMLPKQGDVWVIPGSSPSMYVYHNDSWVLVV